MAGQRKFATALVDVGRTHVDAQADGLGDVDRLVVEAAPIDQASRAELGRPVGLDVGRYDS